MTNAARRAESGREAGGGGAIPNRKKRNHNTNHPMKRTTTAAAALLAALLAAPGAAGAQGLADARLLRYPNTNGEQIVFVYAGDIWTVPAQGGDARQLTTHPGMELFPRISPDGKWIAFSAEYNGNRQVYAMPAQGGEPRQLTYYNPEGPQPPRGGYDNIVLGWTPDSRAVLFRSNRTEYGDRMGRYYTVPLDGGMESELPVPYGGMAALSPDGTQLAFAHVDREFRSWKRYKGGRASDLWIFNLADTTARKITGFRGTDQIPTWLGDEIFFASDRDLWLNIHAYNTVTGQTRQVTRHEGFDVMWPSGLNGFLAYECGGQLYTLDARGGEPRRVVVNIRHDIPGALPYHKDVRDFAGGAAIAPDGKSAAIDARGDIFSVPADASEPTRNLTDEQGVRAHSPAWSPDGSQLAFLSDKSGEYEIHLLGNQPGDQPRQLTSGSRGWKYELRWAPDGSRLLFFDRSMRLQLADAQTGAITVVDTPTSDEILHYAFSPDSRWVAYTKNAPNDQGAIWLYEIATGQRRQATDGTFADASPVFSRCGRYLFFVSNRDFNLSFSAFEFDYVYNNASRIYALALTKDAPRPFGPEYAKAQAANQADAAKGDGKSKGKGKDKDGKEDKEGAAVRVDFDGLQGRVTALPLPTGGYWGLLPVDGGLVYHHNGDVKLMRLGATESETVMAKARVESATPDAATALYSTGADYAIAPLAAGAQAKEKLDLAGLTMRIDPRKEWRQIFDDGWRLFRDYFYVDNLHNVDWAGLRDKYAQLLPSVGHRADLDYILGEMISETNTGHAYVNWGDFDQVRRRDGGLLGARLEADPAAGRYRIAKIYAGENWNPERRSPLTEQGVDVRQGDYLLAVDGRQVTTQANPYQFLENKAGRPTQITVGADPTGKGARSYTITPLKSELELMYLDWVNQRRAMVDSLSGGRIGYIHVPNTAVEGNRELHRGMYAYHHKPALIIDDRFNGGGFIPDRMLELVSRRQLAHWAVRGLDPMRTPGVAHDGPKAMLVNQYSSSGGDCFPYMFQMNKIGTVIGARTWGGLVGISGNPGFVDGGSFNVPRFGIYNDKGEWVVEGLGVTPDIEVIDAPDRVAKGQDPSLEKAVEVLLRELEQNPPREWPKPADPDRSGWHEQMAD